MKTKKKLNYKKIVGTGIKIGIPMLAILTRTGIVCGVTDEPLAVINNLKNFMFQIISAIGIILLLWGIVQVGMAIKSHDPSQRANGFLTLAGGIIIAFAKQILELIMG